MHVQSEFAGAAADEFVASAGQVAHVIEANRSRKLLKPQRDSFRAFRAPATLEQSLVRQLSSQLGCGEQNVHRSSIGQSTAMAQSA